MKRLLAGVLFLLLSLTARAEEILVFAAASLTESMQEIGKAYESKTGTVVRFSFGASSDLARQIKAGAPADVFFSADTQKMDDLERAALVRHEDRREFLSNVLVVVVPASANRTLTGPRDLLRVGRLALADPASVPAGIYAKKWLESIGLWKEIEPRVVPSLDVRAALAAVESEAVPAAIVYKTDSAISRKVKVVLEVTDGPQITYSLARVAASKARAAQEYVDFVDSEAGRRVFVGRGFRVRP
jgi:molybdate transport system substrate-binding protein